MKITNQVIQLVNEIITKDNFSFARKPMTMCGISKDFNIMWHTVQVTQQLQHIISKHQEHINITAPVRNEYFVIKNI